MTTLTHFGISVEGKDLLVKPPKYPSPEVKEILGGRWDKDLKAWRVAPTSLNLICLAEWYGEEFVGTAPEEIQNLGKLDWGFPGFEDHEELRERAEQHPKWTTLYPFQRIAVEYLVCNPHHGAILGLSPGLGKTPVSIVAMDVLEVRRVLVVAPLTLAKNWGKEIARWSSFPREWCRATAVEKDPQCDLTITNFETLFEVVFRDEEGNVVEVTGGPKGQKAWVQAGPTKRDAKTGKTVPMRERITQPRSSYAVVDWDLIIVDESILLKNRKAVKVNIIQQLSKYSHNIWLLSGSPTAKFRDDLYAQVKTIMPRAFASYWRFADFFCIVQQGQWGWTIEGDRPDHDPQKYLRDFYLVMNQKDVLPDLPDYIYDPVEIDLLPQQTKAFTQMVEEWLIELGDEEEEGAIHADNRLAQLTRMQQITSNLSNLEKAAGKPMPSVSAKEELLVDMIKNSDIEFPLLVWAWWIPTTKSLFARLEKEFPDLGVRMVHGGLKAKEKDQYIEEYKAGKVKILILQMGVGKFGHTLTDTRTVFYHDRSFDGDAYLQSLRRVKRIGLTHSPRLIIPRANVSSDPLIEMNLAGKMESISKVASHDLKELLRSLGGLAWAMNSAE